ncbi:uncharacterized protein LOC131044307 [Cryptomeria japonica]|uniref:uncharacterized protein LOC131044307 n=1 Tax=Cryptomeria japonica TaxID=3369 RepID=UPI0025ABF160|nr:uncharacterized protein LOC131044307 [Cryptomeria japonica]
MNPPPQPQQQDITPPPNPNASTPRPTQFPSQPTPNLNNKPQQQKVYSADSNLYPAFDVSLGDIHLCLRTTLPTPSTPLINELPEEEEEHPNLAKDLEPTRLSNLEPPFPQRLEIVKQKEETIFEILDQLKHIFVNIPLFQAMNDVPIYGKAIKEACLKKPRRKAKDPTNIHVVGQLEDIMLGKVIVPKYAGIGSPILEVRINGMQIKNSLIDLGAEINVMTKEIMQQLNIINQRPTTTILQLVDSSIVKPDGIVEDILVSLDSWDYPVDFMTLSPKATLGGYPIILGRPWLATTNA